MTPRQKRMSAMARKVKAGNRSFSTNRLLAHEAGKKSRQGSARKPGRHDQSEMDLRQGDRP